MCWKILERSHIRQGEKTLVKTHNVVNDKLKIKQQTFEAVDGAGRCVVHSDSRSGRQNITVMVSRHIL